MTIELASGLSVDKLLATKVKGEPGRAHAAYIDFAQLGAKRTVTELYEVYLERKEKGRPDLVPTSSMDTLYSWRGKYNWNDRVRAYDRLVYEELMARTSDGLGSAHARVQKLTKLADKLEEEIFGVTPVDPEEMLIGLPVADGKVSKLWLREHRITPNGHITNYTFNNQLVQQYRGILEDIAKEVGGRIPAPLVQVDARQINNGQQQQLVILPDKTSIDEYMSRRTDGEEVDDGVIIELEPEVEPELKLSKRDARKRSVDGKYVQNGK